jgi:hypothetical protein
VRSWKKRWPDDALTREASENCRFGEVRRTGFFSRFFSNIFPRVAVANMPAQHARPRADGFFTALRTGQSQPSG